MSLYNNICIRLVCFTNRSINCASTPLQGRNEASNVASLLAAKGWVPDLILASNAVRTKQTLDAMSAVMPALGDVDSHFYGSL